MNEPKDAATTEIINPIFAETIRQIRRIDPKRTIFVGPGGWNSIGELPKLRLPDDDQNLIVTVHNYDPFYFTHQGADWTGPDTKLTGILFPGPPPSPLVPDPKLKLKAGVLNWVTKYNKEPAASNPSSPRAFQGMIDQAKEWSEYYGRPIYIGEFGCYTAADPASPSTLLPRPSARPPSKPSSAGPSGTGKPASTTGTRRPISARTRHARGAVRPINIAYNQVSLLVQAMRTSFMAFSDFDLKTARLFRSDHRRRPGSPLGDATPSMSATVCRRGSLRRRWAPAALAMNTEKARSELIIAPILMEAIRLARPPVSLFSGAAFDVDKEQGLNGACDYLITRSAERFFISQPLIAVVEAKKEDIVGGLGQCVAAMVAARIFNEREKEWPAHDLRDRDVRECLAVSQAPEFGRSHRPHRVLPSSGWSDPGNPRVDDFFWRLMMVSPSHRGPDVWRDSPISQAISKETPQTANVSEKVPHS